MKLINRKIFTITLVVVAIHFVLTSAIGLSIGIQIRTQTAEINKEICDKIIKAPRNYPIQKSEEVKKLSQKEGEKIEEILRRWRIPAFVISLPITRFIVSPLAYLTKKRLDQLLLSKNISPTRLWTEIILIFEAGIFANSFTFGVIIYAIIIVFNSKSTHNKQHGRTKNKLSRASKKG